MNKRGLEFTWSTIATLMLVLLVLFAVYVTYNKAFAQGTTPLFGFGKQIGESFESLKLSDLTPSDIAKIERESPEARKSLLEKGLEEADKALANKEYSLAEKSYKFVLEKCEGSLQKDCSLEIKTRAEKGIEETKFKQIGTLAGQARISAYEEFIKDYPNSKFVGAAYFEIGKTYQYSGLADYNKAKENYDKAINTGYPIGDIIEHSSALSKTPEETKAIVAKTKSFYESWETALGYLRDGNKEKTLLFLVNAELYLEQSKLEIDKNDLIKFRLDQMNLRKWLIGFEGDLQTQIYDLASVVEVYEALKKETNDQNVLKSAKEKIGKKFVDVVKFKPGSSIQSDYFKKVYGNTGVQLYRSEQNLRVVCVIYGKGNWIRHPKSNEVYGCALFSPSDKDKVFTLSEYPFVTYKLLNFADESGNLVFEVQLDPWEKTYSQEIEIEEGTRKETSEFPGLFVNYNGNQIWLEDLEGEDFSYRINWPYTENPIDPDSLTPQSAAPGVPSISIQHRGYRVVEGSWYHLGADDEFIKVKLIYTP